MTGGCCVCGQPILCSVSYTQHCHDECYIRSLPLESLRAWDEQTLKAPNGQILKSASLWQDRHRELVRQMIAEKANA